MSYFCEGCKKEHAGQRGKLTIVKRIDGPCVGEDKFVDVISIDEECYDKALQGYIMFRKSGLSGIKSMLNEVNDTSDGSFKMNKVVMGAIQIVMTFIPKSFWNILDSMVMKVVKTEIFDFRNEK